MSEDTDEESKTEEPSERRLTDAIERGQVINSREVTNLFMIASFASLAMWFFPILISKLGFVLKYLIENAHDIDITEFAFRQLMINLTLNVTSSFGLFLITMIIVIFASIFIQQGQIIFSVTPITPDLSKISIFKGLSRIFSKKNFIEFLKTLFKIVVIFIAIYFTIMGGLSEIEWFISLDIHSVMNKIGDTSNAIFITVIIILLIVAIADYFNQRYFYYQSLKMTKEEVKQETKQNEPNPEIRKKIKALGQERIKRNLNKIVPKADVIITNPTHYSIALQYDQKTMEAPKVIAKGQDVVALRIREIATKNNIPLVENKKLARALYNDAKVDDFIPLEHYKAVAEVISYIYKLRGKK